MKADIWMPIYIGDYLADTIGLTHAQHGAYLLAMMAYWRNGGPMEDEPFKAILGENFPRISNFFVFQNEKWHHKRIDIEIGRAAILQKNLSKRGKSGAEARWQNDATSIQQALPDQCLNDAKPMPKNAPSPSPSPSPSQSEENEEVVVLQKNKTTKRTKIFNFENFLEELKKNQAYSHIDIDRELAKMQAWLDLPQNRSRKKTPKFILNWLNRIEPHITQTSTIDPGIKKWLEE